MTRAASGRTDADVPPVTRLVVVRHGETTWNAERRMQGQIDAPLSACGRRQAARLAAALEGEGIEAIVASDLSRARDTARALAERLGMPVELDAALRERHFGVFQGSTYADIDRKWPEPAARWRRHDPAFGPEGGERLDAFAARAVAALRRVAAAHAGRCVAVFTHGGVLDALYRAATGVGLETPRSWELDNAAINRLLWSGDAFVVVGWNDAAHLDEESLDDRSVASPTPGKRSED